MPVVNHSSYNSPIWLRNGHLQTIWPVLFRNPPLPSLWRERLETPDGDFIDTVIGRWQIKETMLEYGAMNALMSGSGPTVFGLFEGKAAAREALYALKKRNLARQVYLTEMYQNRRSQ